MTKKSVANGHSDELFVCAFATAGMYMGGVESDKEVKAQLHPYFKRFCADF